MKVAGVAERWAEVGESGWRKVGGGGWKLFEAVERG